MRLGAGIAVAAGDHGFAKDTVERTATAALLYLISAHDRAINPDAERFMAERMGGTIDTIDTSHVAFISRPVATAEFILAALR